MTACPYCQQNLDQAVCAHWVATLTDDSDGYDTVTPLYFVRGQEDLAVHFDRYFKALCALCDQVASKGTDERKRIFWEAGQLPLNEEATLKEAIEFRTQPGVEEDYETAEEFLGSEFAPQMKNLFADFFQRCGRNVSQTDYTIDHSPGLSWSGTHYLAENAPKCVESIIQECEKATNRILNLIDRR